MDTVTYPTPEVQEALTDHFVAVHINTAEPSDEVKRQMRDARMLWTPTLIFSDHHGIELRREVGYIEPKTFLATLGLVRGQAHLLHGEAREAVRVYRSVADSDLDARLASEALYWGGVASLRAGDGEGFGKYWQELKQRFPQSIWWSRASFIDG